MSAGSLPFQPDQRRAPAHADQPDCAGPIAIGLLVGVVLLGCFLGWAAIVPLSRAAVTMGEVRVESHRKTVQHKEGGIIRQILVREGDMVQEGQLLVRIDDTQAASVAATLRSQYDSLLAQEARLLAERDGATDIVFPDDLLRDCAAEPGGRTTCGSQRRIFVQRQLILNDQIAILNQRIEQLHSEIAGRQAQIAAFARQIHIIDDQIASVEPLVRQQLLPKPRLLSLQQQAASLDGNRGEETAQIAKAQQTIGETQMQLRAVVNQRQSEVATDLRDSEEKLAEVRDKMRAATDIQHRTDIVAPQAGRVVNLRFFTPDAVVKPGDPILDIVPQNDNLIVEAHVRPLDIEHIHSGLRADVRLVAYNLRTTPTIHGTVDYVSADTLVNEHSNESYYVANVTLDQSDLERLDRVKLYPGMPAQVMIITGERTMLQYLLEPIRDSFARAFRES